jgi:hypothetical protein
MKMLSWSRYHYRPWLSACVVRRRDLARLRRSRHLAGIGSPAIIPEPEGCRARLTGRRRFNVIYLNSLA